MFRLVPLGGETVSFVTHLYNATVCFLFTFILTTSVSIYYLSSSSVSMSSSTTLCSGCNQNRPVDSFKSRPNGARYKTCSICCAKFIYTAHAAHYYAVTDQFLRIGKSVDAHCKRSIRISHLQMMLQPQNLAGGDRVSAATILLFALLLLLLHFLILYQHGYQHEYKHQSKHPRKQ